LRGTAFVLCTVKLLTVLRHYILYTESKYPSDPTAGAKTVRISHTHLNVLKLSGAFLREVAAN